MTEQRLEEMKHRLRNLRQAKSNPRIYNSKAHASSHKE